MTAFTLCATAPLTMRRTNRLADMYVLSPFVWADGDRFRILVRAVPRRDDEPRLKMAEIWHGVSADGLHFEMDEAPTIFPGPDLVDLDGCEDPTVRVDGDQLRVWFTGWNQQQETGRLLLARGSDVAGLGKAGVAIDSAPAFSNPKEASVVSIGECSWRLFFEFARDEASRIGQTTADNLDGPWPDAVEASLGPREGAWDCWHLSPGPVIGEGTSRPIMFYNGATRDAAWRIGWAQFDRHFEQVIERCAEALIVPEHELADDATDIAFAASALEKGGEIWLYYSQSDQSLQRAVLKRE